VILAVVVWSGMAAFLSGWRHALLLLGAFAGAWMLVPAVARFARARGIVAASGGRSVHQSPTPLLGGVAVYLAFLGCIVALQDARLTGLALGCTLMTWSGAIDDIYGLSPRLKLVCQFLAASTLFAAGFGLPAVSLPPFGSIPTGILEFPLLVLWILLVTNAINLIDGIDGLAAGTGAIILAAAIAAGAPNPAYVILLGGVLGFLRFNLPTARIFLGDTGSLMLGFAVAALLLPTNPETPLNLPFVCGLLALPLGDFALSTVRRLMQGKPIHTADCGHVHHRLLRVWKRPDAVLAFLLLFCAVTAAIAVLVPNMIGGAVIGLLWLALSLYLLGVARSGLNGTLRRRRAMKRVHLVRHYAAAFLDLAETPADVFAVLTRVAQDLGLTTLGLREFHVALLRPGAEKRWRESIDCGSWSHDRSGHNDSYWEEQGTVLSDLLRRADTALECMERSNPEPPAISVLRGLIGGHGGGTCSTVHVVLSDIRQLVRVTHLARAIESQEGIDVVLVGTQPRDQLVPEGVRVRREPDVDMDVEPGPGSLEAVGKRFAALLKVMPAGAVLVARDPSAMVCAREAQKRGIPVAHLDGRAISITSAEPVTSAEGPALDLTMEVAVSEKETPHA